MDTNRDDMVPAAWASWINVVLGVWLIISPWVVGYSFNAAALWNSVLVGIAVLIVSLVAAGSRSAGPSWWNVVLGVWLIISPFILGLGTGMGLVNFIVIGIVVGLLGLTAAMAKSGVAPTGTTAATRPM